MNSLLKRQRIKTGTSIRKLSEKTGISVGALFNYENGLTSPSLFNFSKISKVLNIQLTISTQDEVLTVI